MTQPGFRTVPPGGEIVTSPDGAAGKQWVRVIAECVNRILQGKVNVILPITLTANSATTTVKDARIGGYSGLLLQPLTANAAAALYASPYVLKSSQQDKQVIFAHANDAQTDKSFNLVILG